MSDSPHQIAPVIARGGKASIPALTGLRFLAAFGIMYSHTVGWLTGGPIWFAKTSHFAFFSMTLFFVLSGFVIHYNYSDTIQRLGGIQKFFVARFARLYPLYLLVFLVELAQDSQNPNPYFWSTVTLYFTMSQAWFPIEAIFHPLSGQVFKLWQAYFGLSWSLSVEAFLYLVYIPVSLFVLRRLRTQMATIWAIATLCIAGCGLVWLGSEFSVGTFWLLYTSPYGRIPEFLLGAFVAHLVSIRGVNRSFRGAGLLGLAGAFGIVALLFVTAYWRPEWYPRIEWSWGFAMPVAAVVACLSFKRSWASLFFGSAFLVMLGDGSYSLYLLHPYLIRLFPRPFVGWSNVYCLVLYCTLCTVIAVGVYRGFEAPSRERIRAAYARLANGPRWAAAVGLVWLAAILSGAFALAAEAYDWFPTAIAVTSATYGANCSAEIKPGNVTTAFKFACRGQMNCTVKVDAREIGDPAGGCSKSFEIQYICPGQSQPLTALLAPEAHGKSVTLACPP